LILQKIISVASKEVIIEVFDSIGSMPHFDDPEEMSPVVIDFKARIAGADAV
jgi:hypothetical protein